MNLGSCKNYGGIGAILLIVASLSSFGVGPYGGVLDLAGIILVFVALNGLASYYNERGIFNNALYAIIISIVGAVAVIAGGVLTFLSFLNTTGFDMNNFANATYWQNFFTNLDLSQYIGYIETFIALWVVLAVFIIIAAIFFRRSMNTLSAKTGVGMFGTTGLIILIGACLTAIGIGLIIIWIAWILLAVAFFSIKTQEPQPSQPSQNPSPSSPN